MGADPPDRWSDLGTFIREQRGTAKLSLRRLSELAGISNPYLSQIERGLRRPSAAILQQIARALRISAETLYVQAGILEPPGERVDLGRLILTDPHLTDEQKQVLVRVYRSFRREQEPGGASTRSRAPGEGPGAPGQVAGPSSHVASAPGQVPSAPGQGLGMSGHRPGTATQDRQARQGRDGSDGEPPLP